MFLYFNKNIYRIIEEPKAALPGDLRLLCYIIITTEWPKKLYILQHTIFLEPFNIT